MPPASSTGSVPFQLISSRLPRWCFSGPLMVPLPRRSPTFMAQPDEAWCTSCCTDDQYMYLKLVRQMIGSLVHLRRAQTDIELHDRNCSAAPAAGKAAAPDPAPGRAARNGSSASRVTTHGLIEVAKRLGLERPERHIFPLLDVARAPVVQTCTKPKIISSACCSVSISPIADGCPITTPISSSKSSRLHGPKARQLRRRRLQLAARPAHLGAAHHHGRSAAVVTDRHVQPVRLQRVVLAAEHDADIGGMLLRRIEIGVAGDRDRQMQFCIRHRHQRASRNSSLSRNSG